MADKTEETLRANGAAYVVGRASYADNSRGRIIGDETGFLKLLFRADDVRLVCVRVLGEIVTEGVHVGRVTVLAEGTIDLLNRALQLPDARRPVQVRRL